MALQPDSELLLQRVLARTAGWPAIGQPRCKKDTITVSIERDMHRAD